MAAFFLIWALVKKSPRLILPFHLHMPAEPQLHFFIKVYMNKSSPINPILPFTCFFCAKQPFLTLAVKVGFKNEKGLWNIEDFIWTQKIPITAGKGNAMVSGLLCFIKGTIRICRLQVLVWGPYKQIKLAQVNSLCGVKGSETIVFRSYHK